MIEPINCDTSSAVIIKNKDNITVAFAKFLSENFTVVLFLIPMERFQMCPQGWARIFSLNIAIILTISLTKRLNLYGGTICHLGIF